MTASADAPSFSTWVLERLRAGHFRPQAWVDLLAESWQQARQTANANPRLTASWRWLTGGLSLATGLTVATRARRHGPRDAARLGAILSVATLAQAGDVYAHLGLHRPAGPRPYQHYPHLGHANWLTAGRGWVASWLWARLLAGHPLDDGELILALALITATDIADGPVARRLGQASALGRYLDGEADVMVWAALTLTQVRRRQIPGWLAGAFALRWFVPIGVGFCRTFAGAQPVPLVPSALGRASGALQTATQVAGLIGSVRASRSDTVIWQRLRTGLAGVTAGLLVATMAAQVARLVLPTKEQ